MPTPVAFSWCGRCNWYAIMGSWDGRDGAVPAEVRCPNCSGEMVAYGLVPLPPSGPTAFWAS
jgi:hypothetical protein